jgi:DNA polymerase sigma
LLVVYFLKLKQEQRQTIKIDNVGKLFYEFLIFYSKQFNPKEDIIDPNNLLKGENAEIFDRNFFATQSGLIIIDPLNAINNVGKNTRQFENIKMAFSLSISCMKEYCECGCHYEGGFTNDYLSTEHCLLKRVFSSVKRYISDTFY